MNLSTTRLETNEIAKQKWLIPNPYSLIPPLLKASFRLPDIVCLSKKTENSQMTHRVFSSKNPFPERKREKYCHDETGLDCWWNERGSSYELSLSFVWSVSYILLHGPDPIWIRTGRRTFRCQRSGQRGCSTRPIRPARSWRQSEGEWP